MWVLLLTLLLIACNPVASAFETDDDVRNLLNEIRAQAGITLPYSLNSALSIAAKKHCHFWGDQYDILQHYKAMKLITLHDQLAGFEGYIGDMKQRAENEGYMASVAENISRGSSDFKESIYRLMSSPGHRFNFLRPDLTDLGYHHCIIKKNEQNLPSMYVYMLGHHNQQEQQKIITEECLTATTSVICQEDICYHYPCTNGGKVSVDLVNNKLKYRTTGIQSEGIIQYPSHGSQNVMPASDNAQSYDPQGHYLRGAMISIEFLPDTYKALKSEPEAQLFDNNGQEVHLLQVSRNALPADQKGLRAWLPETRLDWGRQYTIYLSYNLVGVGEKRDISSFTTYVPGENITRIHSLDQQVFIPRNSPATLVFDWGLLPETPREPFLLSGFVEGEVHQFKEISPNVISIETVAKQMILTKSGSDLNVTIFTEN